MEDPIYAAIDTHFDAWLAWNEAVNTEFALDANGDPRSAAARQENWRLSDVARGRFQDLMAMSPTTVAGVAALLEHICGLQAACDSEFTKKILSPSWEGPHPCCANWRCSHDANDRRTTVSRLQFSRTRVCRWCVGRGQPGRQLRGGVLPAGPGKIRERHYHYAESVSLDDRAAPFLAQVRQKV